MKERIRVWDWVVACHTFVLGLSFRYCHVADRDLTVGVSLCRYLRWQDTIVVAEVGHCDPSREYLPAIVLDCWHNGFDQNRGAILFQRWLSMDIKNVHWLVHYIACSDVIIPQSSCRRWIHIFVGKANRWWCHCEFWHWLTSSLQSICEGLSRRVSENLSSWALREFASRAGLSRVIHWSKPFQLSGKGGFLAVA